jgi:hypothetical protein
LVGYLLGCFLPVRARRTHSPAGGVKTVKLFHGVILLCKNKTAGSQVTSRCDKRTLRLQKNRSGILGKQMAVMSAGKHAHAHGHAHLHHHAAAHKTLHAAFSFPLFSDVGIIHPCTTSVNLVFYILSFFLKKKKTPSCSL